MLFNFLGEAVISPKFLENSERVSLFLRCWDCNVMALAFDGHSIVTIFHFMLSRIITATTLASQYLRIYSDPVSYKLY